MKKRLLLTMGLVLAACILIVQAAQPVSAPRSSSPQSGKPAPGVEAAQTISMITGVAISPLLGVSAVGAWKYAKASPEQRSQLPWFANVWFWLPSFLLVGAVFAKDALGPMVPVALKKPLDVAEAMENKVSGLVATGAFVPLAATFISPEASATASLPWPMFAAIDSAGVLNAMLVPFAMITFVVVWIVAHAINILILLSPFATVDAALKSFRLFLLSTVAVTSFVNPYVGAIWSVIIIVICYFLAGWAFRLAVFGTLFVWDYVTFARTRFRPDPQVNWMFLAREVEKTPIRTYGKLERSQEGLVFHFRPWLVLPSRTLKLPGGKHAIGRALTCPELLQVEGSQTTTLLLLPPRYLTHEETLARIYQLGEVEDLGIVKGLKAIWKFIKRLCGIRGKSAPAAAAA